MLKRFSSDAFVNSSFEISKKALVIPHKMHSSSKVDFEMQTGEADKISSSLIKYGMSKITEEKIAIIVQ